MTLQISSHITRKYLRHEDAERAIAVHILPAAPAGYHFVVRAIGWHPIRPQQYVVEAFDVNERFLGYCYDTAEVME